MGQVISLPFKILSTTKTYVFGLLHYLNGAGRHQPYGKAHYLQPPSSSDKDTPAAALFRQHANLHLFSLASNFYLFRKPHYRKGTYQDDLRDNLRNVAIPGTGIPLSWMATTRLVALPILLTVYPVVSLVASVHQCVTTRGGSNIADEYATRLLAPDDWFSHWRHNCNIVGLHSLLNNTDDSSASDTNTTVADDYRMENKWTFLEAGVARGVPVSPFLDSPDAIVVKHRNEEGGLGIHFYKNATAGGDWIIQARMDNSDWVNTLLPPNAPLSTFRVITCSRAGIRTAKTTTTTIPNKDDITALSCVFRAGRAGAATDHDSILFDVDVTTGQIRGGTTNAHWYRLGVWGALTTAWRSRHDYTHHPDGNVPVTGATVPDMKGLLKLAEQSHAKLCPSVPLAGWDVVLSSDSNVPVCLLEVNLSCNFFRGSFDKKVYLDFMDDVLTDLQSKRLEADKQGKVFKLHN